MAKKNYFPLLTGKIVLSNKKEKKCGKIFSNFLKPFFFKKSCFAEPVFVCMSLFLWKLKLSIVNIHALLLATVRTYNIYLFILLLKRKIIKKENNNHMKTKYADMSPNINTNKQQTQNRK